MNRNFYIVCIIHIFLSCINAQTQGQAPYCQKYDDKDAIKPELLPALSGEFSTRMELTVGENRDYTYNIVVHYDSFDNRASLNLRKNDVRAREIFYFDKNEVFSIQDKKCEVVQLNSSTNALFFGFDNTPNGLTIKPPSYVLHFNNGFNYVKGDEQFYRGIPVNHYKSCQEWPETSSSFHVDHYFKKPEFQPGVLFLEDYKEIPVATVVQGLAEINSNTNTGLKFRNEYNYFEFRTLIDDKQDLFQLPQGLFCEGQTNKQPVPRIPYGFSFTEEIITNGSREVETVKVFYSYVNRVARFDITAPRQSNSALDSYKVINDYTSGISYKIDKQTEECTISSINAQFIGALEKPSGLASSLVLKDPQQMFFLDDTYFFAGERMERGIICDVFVSNRTDFKMPNITTQPRYWVFEIFFMSLKQNDFGSDKAELFPPVAIKISAPGVEKSYNIHIYDFDSQIEAKDFDYSVCFQDKKRIDFGISLSPPNILDYNYKYTQDDIITAYYFALIPILSTYNMSPMRIIPPTLLTVNNSYVLYSGVIDTAEAIYHYQKKEKNRIDIELAQYKVASSSAETCAQYCLTSSATDSNVFKCLSFDYCPTQQACVFYNFTLTTDPSVVSQSSPECDHYSKTVELFDAASKDAIFREIQDLVVRKEFNLNIIDDNDNLKVSYSSQDIFLATLQATPESNNEVPIGETSFFNQFLIISFDADFNEEEIKKNASLMLRQRKGISIDECTRLCLREPSFRCESLTYEPVLTECKWSSFVASILESTSDSPVIAAKPGYTFFIRDPFYGYIQFPSQTTTLTNSKVIDVDTDNQCAYLCNKETTFECKSFNLCKQDKQLKCLLSDAHVSNLDKNPNLVYSPICTHYSKNSYEEFKLVPQTQLSATPETKYFNTTVQICAQMCTHIEAFVCKSFDFLIYENTCFLYKEKLKDNMYPNVYGINNANCSHYSRIQYERESIKIQPKYSGGSIFGIVLGVIILCTLVGFVSAFIIIKEVNSRKNTNVPVMSFTNPLSK